MKKFLSSSYRNYLFLIPLCAVALFYQITYSVVSLQDFVKRTQLVRPPVVLGSDALVIGVTPEAIAAGLHMGDRIISIAGSPLTGEQVYFDQLLAHKAAEPILFEYVPKNSAPLRTASVTLKNLQEHPPTIGDWTLATVLILMPLLCIAVGIYAAILRPFDPRALFLLGLLIGVSQLAKLTNYPAFPRWEWAFANGYSSAASNTWALWMLLFALFFPERFTWETRRPRFALLLAALPAAVGLYLTVCDTGAVISYQAMRPITPYFHQVATLSYFVTTLAITGFFTALFTKAKTLKQADAKRRLRILLTGSLVSLTPLLLFVLVTLAEQNNELFHMPEWITALVCLLFCIFPLTLSYVIVVDRAMELRMVVRQGVRYVLARGGVRVLLGLIATLFITAVNFLAFGTHLSVPTRTTLEVAAVLLVIVGSRLARKRLLASVDRRFFREAYKTEQILEELSENVRTMMDEHLLVGTVTRRISESLHVPRVAFLLNGTGAYRPAFAVGLDMSPTLSLSEDTATVDYVRKAADPSPIYFDDKTNWVYQTSEAEFNFLRALDTQLLLPVGLKNNLTGMLSLGPKRSEEPYTRSDVQLLRSVALQTGLALENSRLTTAIARELSQRERLNREIEIAREVQERLFPQMLTSLPGIDYFGMCRPASGVGGDYYDFLALPNGNLGVAIGDVSGKGIAAALLMASLQASLRGQAILGEGNLARLMSNVNQLVFDATPGNRYATFFYGEYNRSTQSFTYVNAGHNPPIILRQAPNGETTVIRLETGGPVVGLFPHAPYQQATTPIDPGDIFVGFTDGISEAMNPADEEWGEERMIPLIGMHASECASVMIPHIIEAADRFVDGAPQHDDMTLVVVKISSNRQEGTIAATH